MSGGRRKIGICRANELAFVFCAFIKKTRGLIGAFPSSRAFFERNVLGLERQKKLKKWCFVKFFDFFVDEKFKS